MVPASEFSTHKRISDDHLLRGQSPHEIAGAVTGSAATFRPRPVAQSVIAETPAQVRRALGSLGLPDLKKGPESAVLVTNGGLGLFDAGVDRMGVGVEWNFMGLSIGNSAKHKLVRLLTEKLKPEGVFVGEVIVLGTVKGTVFDAGQSTLEPARVAEEFWTLYRARAEHSTQVG